MTVHNFEKKEAPEIMTHTRDTISTIGSVLLHLESLAATHKLDLSIAGIRFAQHMLVRELNPAPATVTGHAEQVFKMLQEDLDFIDQPLPDNVISLYS